MRLEVCGRLTRAQEVYMPVGVRSFDQHLDGSTIICVLGRSVVRPAPGKCMYLGVFGHSTSSREVCGEGRSVSRPAPVQV